MRLGHSRSSLRPALPRYPKTDWLRTIATAMIAGLVLCSCGDDDSDSFPSEVSLDQVVEELRTVHDDTRDTPPNGDFPGASSRTLELHLWYSETPLSRPACDGNRCALLLLAHGFGGRAERFDAVGMRLAAAGYIVAAVTFPLTNQDAPGGFIQAINDTVNQPGDLSAVIDALLEANRDNDDPLYRRIDERTIGAMGHSLGGATLVAATRSECCADPRLRTTIYVEPAAAAVEALFGAPYSPSGPPTLTFQGEVAFPISPEASRDFHAGLDGTKMLVEMIGGNHINMVERFADAPDPLLESAAATMIAFLDRYLTGGDDRIAQDIDRLLGDGHSVDYSPRGE